MNSTGIETCMILAAGYGSRLFPVTSRVPKPAVPLFNLPVLIRTARHALSLGVRRLVINVSYQAEYIERLIKDSGLEELFEVFISHEEQVIGTGGGILKAAPLFAGQRVLVINSDIVFDFDLRRLLQRHIVSGNAATLLLFSDSRYPEKQKVVLDDATGLISTFKGWTAPIETRYVFSGIHIAEVDYLRGLTLPGTEVTSIVHDAYCYDQHQVGGHPEV